MKEGSLPAQAAALVTVAAAIGALRLVEANHASSAGWAILVLAGLGLAAVRLGAAARPAPPSPAKPRRTLRWALTGTAAVLLAITLILSQRLQAPYVALAAWIGSITAAIFAGTGRMATPPRRATPPWSAREIATLSAVLAIAALARTLWINDVPPYIFGDEPRVGIALLRTFPDHIESFFTIGWNTWPKLGLAVQGLFAPLLGLSTSSLRYSSALMGVLAVLAVYLLARELFAPRHALLAAVLLALCRTAIDFSRLGICHAQVMFVETLAFYLWWRAVNRGGAGSYVGAGICLGLCYYTYNAGQIALPLWLAWVVLCALGAPRLARSHWRGVLLTLAGFLIAVSPLLLHVTDRFTFGPNWVQWTYMSRNRQTMTQALQAWSSGGLAAAWAFLAQQIWRTWLGFTVLPAGIYLLGYRGGGMLDAITGALFLLGLIYAGTRLWRARYGFLCLWWLATSVVGGVMTDGPPAYVRLIGILPALALLAATPLRFLLAAGAPALRRGAGLGVAGLLVAAIAWANFDTYFIRFPQEEYDPMSELVDFTRDLPADSTALLLGPEHFLRYTRQEVFDLDLPNRDYHDVAEVAQVLPYHGASHGVLALVLGPTQVTLSPYARRLYPGAVIDDVIRGRDKKLVFRTVEISAENLDTASGLRLDGSPSVVADPLGAGPKAAGAVSWSGAVYWPTWQPARLEVDSNRRLVLKISGAQFIAEPPGARFPIELPRGWQPIEIGETVDSSPREVEMKVVAGDTPYALERRDFFPNAGVGGLLAEFSRDGAPIARSIEPEVNLFAVETFFQEDPDFLRAPFQVRWSGSLRVDPAGIYTFETDASGPHRLALDETPVLDVPEIDAEQPRSTRVQVELAAGIHPLEITYDCPRTDHTTRRVFQLYWTPPGGDRELVPADALVPPAIAFGAGVGR